MNVHTPLPEPPSQRPQLGVLASWRSPLRLALLLLAICSLTFAYLVLHGSRQGIETISRVLKPTPTESAWSSPFPQTESKASPIAAKRADVSAPPASPSGISTRQKEIDEKVMDLASQVR